MKKYLLGGCIPLLSVCSRSQTRNKLPNIIFIISDDHAYQVISAYQDRFSSVAPTPNIDRIAKEGMRFNRCSIVGKKTPGHQH